MGYRCLRGQHDATITHVTPFLPVNPVSQFYLGDSSNIRAMYILYIMDSSRKVTDIPQAGVLGSNLGFAFGMYEPQSYTPLPSKTPHTSDIFPLPCCHPFPSYPGPGS